MIEVSAIRSAGTRHSVALIRLPAVNLDPTGILSIVRLAPAPAAFTVIPSSSGSLTGPLLSCTTSVGATLGSGAGNIADVNDCQLDCKLDGKDGSAANALSSDAEKYST
jgi:hypothetical protein